MVKTISQLYLETRRAFMKRETPEDASLLARNLVCHVTGKTQEQMLADRELYVSKSLCEALEQAVLRIQNGEPLAYVLGQWEFYGMQLFLDRNVLIPRDDTCAVTSLAVQQALFLGDSPRILDLCTGSGCIGLAIASRVRDAKITLADISRAALNVARKNATLHKLTGRVSCVMADALSAPDPFLGKFDMIVSNPPYITTKEMEQLPVSVKEFEPHLALHGGDSGLIFYEAICRNFSNALKPGGYICFEFGMGQGDDVCRLLTENGFTVLERAEDFNHIERAVLARYDRKEV